MPSVIIAISLVKNGNLIKRVDLPELTTIVMGKKTLSGDSRREQRTMDQKPFGYKNTLVMESKARMQDSILQICRN